MNTQILPYLMRFSAKTKLILGLSGLAGCAMVAYALYFDHRRRTSGDYKARVRMKRKLQSSGAKPKETPMRLPPVDASGLQHFFLQEVQLGEEMLLEGHTDEGIDHLAMAILMCNKPDQVMGVFRQTLSESHFSLLERSIPKARRKFAQLMANSSPPQPLPPPSSTEAVDDYDSELEEVAPV